MHGGLRKFWGNCLVQGLCCRVQWSGKDRFMSHVISERWLSAIGGLYVLPKEFTPRYGFCQRDANFFAKLFQG